MSLNFNNREVAAQSALTNGPTRDTRGFNSISMTTVSNGTTSSGVIQLQGSADGTSWYVLATRTLTVAGVFNDAVTSAHRFVRVAITTIVGGSGTVDVWLTMLSGALNNDAGFGVA
jgi:hypothetical protein